MTTPDNWRKSSFSGGGDGNDCLELAFSLPAALHLRESDCPSTILTAGATSVDDLLRAIRDGDL
ncbi:DUF397 domain-containing protein [Streptomyces sp. CAI-85]|uniref:DUF397 domain-containing protein n=1 Tax=Streptomyces TaxID=1883 RepID=UPI0015878BE0|nr:DUF397 domain-containing protein [Streptomyces sp. CAI-85]NUV61472.1 DUF397 domain-containing protein [Streptomyces sp. CAI-85]